MYFCVSCQSSALSPSGGAGGLPGNGSTHMTLRGWPSLPASLGGGPVCPPASGVAQFARQPRGNTKIGSSDRREKHDGSQGTPLAATRVYRRAGRQPVAGDPPFPPNPPNVTPRGPPPPPSGRGGASVPPRAPRPAPRPHPD